MICQRTRDCSVGTSANQDPSGAQPSAGVRRWYCRRVILETRASIHVPRPVEVVFDHATDLANLPRLLGRKGPIPAIARAQKIDETRRRVDMSDGSSLEETVLVLERPHRHVYRWSEGLRPPLSLLVRWGEADWSFRTADGGTEVEWVYRFELRTLIAYPIAAILVRFFRSWMTQGLARLRIQA
jgi:uncharacterized protein YndB with AHSA1/START domain